MSACVDVCVCVRISVHVCLCICACVSHMRARVLCVYMYAYNSTNIYNKRSAHQLNASNVPEWDNKIIAYGGRKIKGVKDKMSLAKATERPR